MKETIFGIEFEGNYKNAFTTKYFPEQNIRIGKGCTIGRGTIIRSNVVINDNVTIGNNCQIGNFVLIRENVTLGNGVKIGGFNSIESSAFIDDGTRTQSFCMISEFSVIGSNVFLGPFFNNPADNTIGQPGKIYNPQPSRIEDNCRIGSKVVVTPGNIIGKGTIIGAGSVVTKSTGRNELWYGNPASRRSKK